MNQTEFSLIAALSPFTIFVAEAKSSINGAGVAKLPVGTPQARLDKWINDFDRKRYEKVDTETRANIQQLQDLYRENPPITIKGIWIQVEAPALNTSKVTPYDVIIHLW